MQIMQDEHDQTNHRRSDQFHGHRIPTDDDNVRYNVPTISMLAQKMPTHTHTHSRWPHSAKTRNTQMTKHISNFWLLASRACDFEKPYSNKCLSARVWPRPPRDHHHLAVGRFDGFLSCECCVCVFVSQTMNDSRHLANK